MLPVQIYPCLLSTLTISIPSVSYTIVLPLRDTHAYYQLLLSALLLFHSQFFVASTEIPMLIINSCYQYSFCFIANSLLLVQIYPCLLSTLAISTPSVSYTIVLLVQIYPCLLSTLAISTHSVSYTIVLPVQRYPCLLSTPSVLILCW